MMKKFLTVLCVVLMTLFAAACTQENNAVLPDANAVADSPGTYGNNLPRTC